MAQLAAGPVSYSLATAALLGLLAFPGPRPVTPSVATQPPDATQPALVVDAMLDSSSGVTGIAGATMRPDGVFFLLLRTGIVARVSEASHRTPIARLDSVELPLTNPVPIAANASTVFVYDLAGPAILEVDLGTGGVTRHGLSVTIRPVQGMALYHGRLLLAGYTSRAPQYAIHEFSLPSLVYRRSFGRAREFATALGRQQFTGGTLNLLRSTTLIFGELNPPRLEVFSSLESQPLVCQPTAKYDDAEKVAIRDSANVVRVSSAFPKSRGGARLANGVFVLSAFDIRSGKVNLTFFDKKCVEVHSESLAADFWILGVDSLSRLYALRTYGNQDLVRYRIAR